MGGSLGHVHDRSFVIRAFICGYFNDSFIARAPSEGGKRFFHPLLFLWRHRRRERRLGYFFTHVTSFLVFVHFSV